MRITLLLWTIVAAASPAWADSAAGASSFDFLTIDANARAVGMGGAYTALASDSNALLYNPAGLARVDGYEATFMHNVYAQGLSQEYVGFAAKQGWGLSLNYLDFGSINRTTLSQPGGTGSSFGVNDFALAGSYARAVTEDLSLGAGAKLLRETLDSTQANGFALDVGALYRVRQLKGLSFGASVLNMGPDVRFASHDEKLPLLWRLGTGFSFPAFKNDNTLALDVTRERADRIRMGFGIESVYDQFMAFRFGFTTRNDAGVGITAGVGWIWKALSVDYAISPLGSLGISNRVSATVRWGGAARSPGHAARPEGIEGISDAKTPEGHFVFAQKLIEGSHFTGAKAELAAALSQLGPDDRLRVLYYERMGTIARFEGDIPAAKYSYAEAMKLSGTLGMSDPVVADAYTGFGLCLVAQGDTAQAVKFFRKALEVGASPRTVHVVQDQLKQLRSTTP
ncbi:MAG: tetratricopeptide repeat protein [Elusimicrobia bacterium]|nr:tetratricopeptide repeat protein [Elusimicrobiota bacterium]